MRGCELELISVRFNEIREEEQAEINGGAIIVPILIGIALAIIADEVVERTTGKDICGHVGDAFESAGRALESAGRSLYN